MDASSRSVGNAVEREILWRAIRADPKVFFETVWKIKLPRQRPQVMTLYPCQHDIVDMYQEGHDRYVALKARQIGWTTITTGWAFWTSYFEEYTPWLFISHTEGFAKKNLAMVKFGYANLPEWVKEKGPELKTNTTELMEWENGSRHESIPATGSAGRGEAVYGVMWDEAAYAPDPEGQYAAIEPLVYGPLIQLSTANGYGNLFEQTYNDSKKPDSVWRSIFVPWSGRPNRDEEWYKKKANEYRAKGQEWILHQEYPRNDVEAFAKSGRNPIPYEIVEAQEWEEPLERMYWDGTEFEYRDEHDPNEMVILDIWEPPTVMRDPDYGHVIRQPNYVLFADTAEGLAHGDATAIAVYDANDWTCVAEVQTRIAVEQIPEIIDWIGRHYMLALVAVERNKDGWGILHYMNTVLHYPRLFTMPKIANRRSGHADMLGWHTNSATKPKMVRDFARAMTDQTVHPRSPKLKMELVTFIQHDNGSYGASTGNHDDLVIAHMGAYQLCLDVGRFPIVWVERKGRPMTMAELDEVAFGAVSSNTPRFIGQHAHSSAVRAITITPRQTSVR